MVMPLPFDATLKEIGQDSPQEFLAAVNAPTTRPVALLNVDLSTVTTATDLVFGLGQPPAEIVHVDFQSGPDADLHLNLLAFHALLHRRFQVPVHTILMLLRPRARHPNLTGVVRYEPRPGHGKMDFGYQIINVWEWPVEPVLSGALGLLPLAPLCQLPAGVSVEAGLAQVIGRLVDRLQAEAAPERAKKLITAAFVLSGLRIDRAVALQLFQGVRAMRDSTTYQYILEEGRAEGSRHMLLRLGRKHLGEPDAATLTQLQAITDVERLERLGERLLDVGNWQELLQTP
jgi:predicted transposase YdaD